MGAWGTGINQNDTYQDLIIEFMDLYNDNVELKDIPKLINEKNDNIANDMDEYSSYWFAMAMGQWKCGGLQPEVLEKVQEIYNTNKGLDLWNEENAAEKGALEKHRKAIFKFIEKIKVPNEKPTKRKKIIPRPCYFVTGDCLSIKLSNGLYGAAYVLNHNDDPKDGQNVVAYIDYFSEIKPTVNDILNCPLLKHDYDGWPNAFAVKLFLVRTMAKHISKIELVGSEMPSSYSENFFNTKFKHVPISNLWSWNETDKLLNRQFEFNKQRKKDYEHITISQLISDNCDNHWYRFKGRYDKIK